ncbi:MAG TPA: HAD-IA family hydrolase [Luteitalea sp.]|nr:HAD-IA family hydrolase [Luteitalea sp.]
MGVFYRHFVFDLDGTLIDSRQDLADAANAMLATYDAPALPMAAVVAMVGEGARTLVSRVLAAAGRDGDVDVDEALERFLTAYDVRLVATTAPYDGVRDTLVTLHAAARVSVLTNKPQRATDRVLDELGLSRYIHAAIGGDTALGRKPGPAGLHALIADSGVTPADTVMVGDSWVDVATARAAGVDACLVSYGFGYAGADADHRTQARCTIASFDELRRFVRC